MILTTIIGNTNTRLTWFSDRVPVRRRIIRTPRLLADPQRFFRPNRKLTGVAFASVVPAATKICLRAIRKQTGVTPFCPNRKSRTGLEIHYDLAQLGPDRLCVAEGGHARYPGNLVILDFGTAVTVNIVTSQGRFLGGPILPSPSLMLDGLNQTTARLPKIRARKADRLAAHDTRTAMQAGTFHLLLGGLDHIIKRIESETRRRYSVIATGGGTPLIQAHIKAITAVDQDLAAYGLLELLYINHPPSA